MSTVAVGFIAAYCFSLVLVMMGLYLQNTLKLTSSETGLYFLAMTLAVGILSPIGGKLADHMDIRIPITTGSCLTVLALMLLSQLDATSSALIVLWRLTLSGSGIRYWFPIYQYGNVQSLKSIRNQYRLRHFYDGHDAG